MLCGLICVSPALGFLPAALAVGVSAAASAVALVWVALAIRPRELVFLSQIGTTFLIGASLIPIWIALQIAPLSALAHPVWSQASEALQHPLRGTISIDIGLTAGALLTSLSGLCIAMVAAAIAVDARRAQWLASAIFCAGIIHAVAMAAGLALDNAGLALETTPLVSLVVILMGLATALELLGSRKSRSRMLALPALAIASSVLLLGLQFRGSGLVAATAGVFIVALVWGLKRFRVPVWAASLAALSLTGLAIFTTVALRSNPDLPFVISFADAQDSDLQRSLGVLADTPALGTGAGTIPALLPTYFDGAETKAALSTAAAGIVVQFGRIPALVFAGAVMALVGILVLGALDRGKDWFYCAAASGSLVALIAGSLCISTILSTADVFVLGTALGCAISQRVSRTRTQDA
ncbi:hypothetical protein SSBR45G_16770 [Bradyrhizobium sp. SSBR45G]|nr:hypothetical protein SSBR45G_16770 [Bradyrhizobium sp. SSBR45G]GLH83527.1 hypothetical protein SSBR45R_09870 [Bradyrhizobium sp. SSBR45R]